jgi:2-phosphosulfolactate phosphatase
VLLSYFHTSEAVPPVLPVAEGGPDAAVVIDVLRATTTIAWALQNGAEAIQAFADLGELEAAASGWMATTWAIRPWPSPRTWWAASASS